jgi:inosose dehydratase
MRRVAAAPISWGVCEVPGWGLMLPPERVLDEMASLGIRATELGPTGYLGDSAEEVSTLLSERHMRLVGGFVPVVLHDRARRAESERIVQSSASLLAAAGADVFVTAVVVDLDWSPRRELDRDGWRALAEGLQLVDDICAAHGLTQVLHPHVGTLVETAADVEHALAVSGVRWCLDTGHLTLGGVDPVRFAAAHAQRVGHVHLKDVSAELAARVRAGELSLLEATRLGLFRPLGSGDVDVAQVVERLECSGYAGWYVLEQDASFAELTPPGASPLDAVRESLRFLTSSIGATPAGVLPVER